MKGALEKTVSFVTKLVRLETCEELYELAAEAVKEVLNADRSALLLFGKDDRVHFVSWNNLSRGYRVAVDGHSPWAKTDLSARPIFIDDVIRSELPDYVKNAVLSEGIGALCFVPLYSPRELLGKFMVYYDNTHRWTEEEKQLAELLADSLSAIILRIRSYEKTLRAKELHRRGESIQRILNRLLKISLENISLDKKLESALDILTKLPEMVLEERAAIFLADNERKTLVLKAHKNLSEFHTRVCNEVPYGCCLCGLAARHGKIQFADCIDHRHTNTYEGIKPHGHYCVPIMDKDELLGVLVLYTPDGQKRTPADNVVLENIADALASTIVHHRIQSALCKAESDLSTFASVVHQSTEAIVITDSSGSIEYVNPAFEKITGYSASEVIGKNPRILKSGAHTKEFFAHLWKTISEGGEWAGRIINRNKKGNNYTEEAVIFPIKDEQGSIIKYCKIARDVSREVLLEEQLQQSQKLEALGSLAGGIAHDFNNLLTAIKGYAEISLERINERHPLYKPLNTILHASRSAENLVKQLLAFSRQQISQPAQINLNTVIKGLRTMLRKVIEEDITIEYNLASEESTIFADPVQIEQILLNLVVNARDALKEKVTEEEKRIIISTEKKYFGSDYQFTHPDARPGEYMVLSVFDNGIGMDKETKKRIFEPFFTTKEKGKGTGLGLSTVYGIVKQNKGSIYVYSEPGVGTTFKVLFPVYKGKQNKEEVKQKEKAPELPVHARVLIVEDNEEVRVFLKDILETFKLEVYTARNGVEALEMIKNSNLDLDLVITDLIMPKMGGKEFFKKISQLKPDIKVIFTSGYSEEQITEKEIDNKNTFFIQKPFSAKKLLEILNKSIM